jgi:hypothetical protein
VGWDSGGAVPQHNASRVAAANTPLRDALRAGKRFLKEANGSAAMVRFEKALMLSKAICDKVGQRGLSCTAVWPVNAGTPAD